MMASYAGTENIEETISTPNDRIGVWLGLRTIWAYRELLWTMTIREVRVRYKQAALGVAWAIIQPLCMMFVFSLFFGRLAKIPSDGLPYPIFSYCALVPWAFFASALQFSMISLASNANLLSKVYFPREILPLSSVLAAAVDFGIASLVFTLMILFYGVSVGPTLLYIAPLILIQVLLTIAVGLLLSALNVG